MKIIKTKFKLKNKIFIDEIKLTFRKLSIKEKKSIIKIFDRFLFNNTDKLLLARKFDLNNKDDSIEKYFFWSKLTKEEVNFYMTYNLLINSNFRFLSRDEIINSLDNYIVIENDSLHLEKYIDKNNEIKFISNLLSLYGIYNNPLFFNKEIRNDYSIILEDVSLDINNNSYYEILMTFAVAYRDTLNEKIFFKFVPLDMKYLKYLKILFSKFSEKDIRNFISCLDSMYTRNDMVENRIINYTATIERLLISSNSEINKNFVLKSGLILKKYLKSNNDSSNESIKKLLSFCYNVRSCIVHGNEDEIIDSFSKLTKKDKRILKLVSNNPTTYREKLYSAYSITETILCLTLSAIIKFWFDSPSELNFLKMN